MKSNGEDVIRVETVPAFLLINLLTEYTYFIFQGNNI